jgi:hypothetical protein
MSQRILKGRWFHITVLDVDASTEDKFDDVKDSVYEEMTSMFDKFPKHHMKMFIHHSLHKYN